MKQLEKPTEPCDVNQPNSRLTRLAKHFPIINPLVKRDFRLLWIGEGISLLGNQFHFIALSWLTLQLTGSGLALGSVLMVGAIPRAILMLFGGVLSDKYSPRRIILISNLSRATVVGIIAFIIFFDIVELWHFMVF